MSRPSLAPAAVAPEVLAAMGKFHSDVVKSVGETVAKEPVVVVGMAMNPFVKKVRAALTHAGIEYKYLEFGGYASKWKERLAIKLWSGFPTFPQVFVKGVLVGGANDVAKLISTGALTQKSLSSKG